MVTRSGTGSLAHSAVLSSRPVKQRGLVPIVGPATKLDVVDRRLSAGRVRNDMVELQEATFATAPAIAGDESAAVLISFRDRSLDVRRLDAVERGVLGEPEYVEAVSERRGKPSPSKRRRASNSARWAMSATVASRSPWASRGISARSWESVREEACDLMAIDTTAILEASWRLYDASLRSRSASARAFFETPVGRAYVACGWPRRSTLFATRGALRKCVKRFLRVRSVFSPRRHLVVC